MFRVEVPPARRDGSRRAYKSARQGRTRFRTWGTSSAAHLVSTVLFCSIHGCVGTREQVVGRGNVRRGKGGDANADSQTENALSDQEFRGLDPLAKSIRERLRPGRHGLREDDDELLST